MEMIERRRMCLDCGLQLQQAGISCVLMNSGGPGVCPRCKKENLCYNWKVPRRKKTGRKEGGEDA